jgi:hypothetical protein
MKKIFTLALIACSAVFAQEAAPAPSAETAAAPAGAAQPVAAEAPTEAKTQEAATPAASNEAAAPVAAETAAPASDSSAAPVAAEPAVDTAKVAAPAEEPAADSSAAVVTAQPVPQEVAADTAKAVEPAEEVPANVAADSEKRWTHFLGAGFSVPVSQFDVDHKKIDVVSYAVNVSYLGVSQSGFAAKLSLATGFASTDNIRFENSDNDWQVGSYFEIELGLGYSFVNTQSFTLALLAVVGTELDVFESEKKEFAHAELGKVDRRFSEGVGALTLGGDIIARLNLSERMSLFASVGGRWLPVSVGTSSVEYTKDDFTRTETYTDSGYGVYSVVPTLGLMRSF